MAFDINEKAIELVKDNINFAINAKQLTLFDEQNKFQIYEPELRVGDARNLSFLPDNSIDLICAHPPYTNIIHYTDSKEGDLSFLDIDEFLQEMTKVARESIRVLKPGRQCAILIGDMRKEKHVIPLGFKFIDVYLETGFKLTELVIKRQHNCKTTGFWYNNSIKYNFLLLAHEYLPIFEKPRLDGPAIIKEKVKENSVIISVKEKLHLEKILDTFETTTVWILPVKGFEKLLIENVINRYANGKGYSIISFTSRSENEKYFAGRNSQESMELLFIKAPFLNINPSRLNIEHYLNEIKEIVNSELHNINKGGFLILQTQDIRIDGYLEPIAKKIVNAINLNELWLKEIVIVTQENNERSSNFSYSSESLKINHQYLLIYEKLN
jgi:hypothetical protein